MVTNLLESLAQGIGPQFTQNGERLLSVSHTNMVSAFNMALPALFAGIVQKGASFGGAQSLMRVLDRPGLNPNIASNLDSYLGGDERTNNLASLGQSILPDLFGSRTSNVVNTISRSSGLGIESASRLLALAAPTVLSFLKGLVSRDHLDARSLSDFLSEQGPTVGKTMDPQLAGALGAPSPAAFVARLGTDETNIADEVGSDIRRMSASTTSAARGALNATEDAARRRTGGAGSWLWLALAAVIAVFLAMQLANLFKRGTLTQNPTLQVEAQRQQAVFTLPSGRTVSVASNGAVANMIRALQNNTLSIGQTFSSDDIHFDVGSAQVKTESLDQLDQLATVMKAYPTVQVLIRGYTDTTGNAAANQNLSESRAGAVKQALVERGVGAERISAAGMGEARSDQPSLSARRVEIAITKL